MARLGCYPVPNVYPGWPVACEDISGFVKVPPMFRGQVLEAPPGVESGIYILFDPSAERTIMERAEAEKLCLEKKRLSVKMTVKVRKGVAEADEEVTVTLVGPTTKDGRCQGIGIDALLVDGVSNRIRVPDIEGHRKKFPVMGREKALANKLIAATSGTPRLIIGRDHQKVWPLLAEQCLGVENKLIVVTFPLHPYLMVIGHMQRSSEVPKRKLVTPKFISESPKENLLSDVCEHYLEVPRPPLAVHVRMAEDEKTPPRKRAAVGIGDFPTILPESVTSLTSPWPEVCIEG
jgi:hypothetical protein